MSNPISGVNNSITDLNTRSKTVSSEPSTNTATPSLAAPVDTSETADSSVKLSTTSSIIDQVNRELASYPEVDESRVAELKAQIASGEYYPDSNKIAGKIMMLEAMIGEES